MPLVFAATLFISATLLFLLQPMIGKMVLPLLGGSPSVWTTCMVFFQTALLAGYLYAHAVSRLLAARLAVLLQIGLLLICLIPLLIMHLDARGIGREWMPDAGQANPTLWLLALLAMVVGLPFFVVSISAPLLQKWFAGTGHSKARDPYFLYGASNFGSMLALISYPTVIEPFLRLHAQSWMWIAGYGLLVLFTAWCGILVLKRGTTPTPPATGEGKNDAVASEHITATPPPLDKPASTDLLQRLTILTRLRWVALAFVPSSLMIGVTNHITTDVAAIPLLWVIPLGIYLFSFILVFGRLPAVVHLIMILLLPGVIIWLVAPQLLSTGQSETLIIGMHLFALFVAAMVCHGELVRTRPATPYLTEFYLWMSFGGVLGGVFNCLVAPLVFNRIIEYPLVIVLACLLLPRSGLKLDGLSEPAQKTMRWMDNSLTALVAFFGVWMALFLLGRAFLTVKMVTWLPEEQQKQAVRLGFHDDRRILVERRGFFGQFQVKTNEDDSYHWMIHGTTLHGLQATDPEKRLEPLAYFHRQGPIGQLFEAAEAKKPTLNVGVIGMGTGTLAAYAKPGWEMTFFEIDEEIDRIARNPRYFTYISDAEERMGAKIVTIPGDGRLEMHKKAPNHHYDLLFIDAFTSDAVPVHLLTKEALVDVYLKKLAPGGIIVINIANRYLKFDGILANLAQEVGIKALWRFDDADPRIDKYANNWLLLAKNWEDFGKLPDFCDDEGNPLWSTPQPVPRLGFWTDDYSNLLLVFRW